MNLVFVLHQDGTPLMPTSPAKARHLLAAGKAKQVNMEPFTIQLADPCGKHVAKIRLGIDLGADEVGFAAVDLDNLRVLYQGEADLRTDIHKRMKRRAKYRRTRRSRKCRYRAPRFDNRASSRRKGLRQPSIKSRSDTVIKIAKRISGFLPISEICVERTQFDTQAMRSGGRLPNWAYQRGELYHRENIKTYVRHRDKYTCQYCGEKNPKLLTVDHIIPESRDGPTAPHNLVAACYECNRAKGNMTAEEFGHPEVQNQVRKSLRAAAHTQTGQNVTIAALARIAPISETFGYITKVDRQEMGLSKTHHFDAVAIASEGKPVESLDWVEKMRAVSKGQRQQFKANPSRGHVFKACRMPYEVFGFRLWDKVELQDGTIGFIGARRKTGSFTIKDIDGNIVRGGISYKKLRLLQRANTLMTEIQFLTAMEYGDD